MVHIRQSEYVRAFSPRLECYARTYKDNLDFRQLRKKTQQAHHSIEWEDESSSSDNEDLNCSGISTRKSKLPAHKYKHEKFTRKYSAKPGKPSKRQTVKQQNVVDSSSQTVHEYQDSDEREKPYCDHGVQTPDWNKDNSGKSSRTKQHVTEDMKSDHVPQARPRKPFQGVTYRKPLPKPRPMSAPLGRPAKKISSDPKATNKKKPPFVPYGFLERESETATKKTHNVLASTDVYPAAVRASRRRKIEIDKREEDLKKTPYKNVLRRDPFMEKMAHETAGWDTEYRQHYVPYHGSLYQRALSARLDPRTLYC